MDSGNEARQSGLIGQKRKQRSRLCFLWLLAGSAAPLAAQDRVAPASAQAAAPAQPDIIFATEADTQIAIANAKAGQKEGQTVGPLQTLVRIPGYRALVEHRTGPTPASLHVKNAEFIHVLEGSGTLITGGTLDSAKHTNPTNQRGSGITGGVARPLEKGTSIFLPPGMPHYFAAVGPKGLSVIALHIPPEGPKP